jgi:hypothetical protein
MAPHVSRFVTRLFQVGAETEAMAAATRAYDDLFRFKIDFVRRRALPLLKGGGHVEATADDHALVDRYTAGAPDDKTRELLLARAGCALLDREEALRAEGSDADKAALAVEMDALKRWSPRTRTTRATATGSSSAFPRTSTTSTWCPSSGPEPAMPERWSGRREAAPTRGLQAHR